MLTERLERFGDCKDPMDMWRRMGIAEPERVTDLEVAQMRSPNHKEAA